MASLSEIPDGVRVYVSAEFRQRYGLLTHDCLIALDLADHGIPRLASADAAFDRLSFLKRASPGDLPAVS